MRLELVANSLPHPPQTQLTPESVLCLEHLPLTTGLEFSLPPPPDHGGSLSGKPQIIVLGFSQEKKAFGGKAKMRVKENFPLRNQQ